MKGLTVADKKDIKGERITRLKLHLENEHSPRKINEYLGLNEAAEYLGVHKDTLRIWADKKVLRSYANPFGRKRLFLVDDLRDVLVKLEKSW